MTSALLVERQLIELSWAVRIRWLAAAAQVGLVGVVLLGRSQWPLLPLIGVAVVGVFSNAALHRSRWHVAPSDGLLVGILTVDVGLLTTVLLLTGGSSNPFTLLYLVPVVVAALLVQPRWTGLVYGVATVAYAGLFVWGPPPQAHHDAKAMGMHLAGMFLAYALGGGLLGLAVVRIRAALAAATRQERAARDLQDRAERLASLATLAAGASHELATPLSTILLISKELERRAEDPVLASELQEIHQEVLRCRSILDQLSMNAGTGRGEAWTEADLGTFLNDAVETGHHPVRIEASDDLRARLPIGLVAQAVRRLLENARLASPEEGELVWRGRLEDRGVVIEVQDNGVGIAPEDLPRVVEPFFTTRATGEGSGLGLFFVNGLMRQLGGELVLESQAGQGTLARMVLPQGAGHG